MSKAAQSPRAPDWIPVAFRLTQETQVRTPAVGFEARLGRGNQGASKEEAIRRESDEKGTVDFGVVQPGDWEFTLGRTMEGGGQWSATGGLNVLPGTTIEKTIVCPKTGEQRVQVSVHFDWPDHLPRSDLGVITSLRHQGLTYQAPLHWSLSDPNGSIT